MRTQIITKAGVEAIYEEMDILKSRLDEVIKERGEIIKTESPVESFAYEQNLQTANEINRMMDIYKSRLQNSVVVDIDTNSDTANIGSKLLLEVTFPGETETEVIQLQITDITKFATPELVSINSPLGHAVSGKKEGDEFNYSVNGEMARGKIIKIHNHAS